MGYEPITHCRHCGSALDVYREFEHQFCDEDCDDAYHALKALGEPNAITWKELKSKLNL